MNGSQYLPLAHLGFLTIFMTEAIHKPIADFVTSLNPIVELLPSP